ncbi:uncharacterized protein B0J16DRAFT_380367 [Fusarium flagelliforme]|uniref:Uncharacterized protein n=1 Tax=Fusarium flagelliforme TaxID=2675880 RepID=A0A395MQ01_9HYPO|nr:uncharacterized protein B0J16DRAFT_380367 [Fusarium flagelliforme]KAH7192480.1 hypothetical protein B0J16DRAFT_380367 [Fusarium flagelliforme]RFN50006.1 hypothetical protein FIE12Z_5702 [Fusarium flagelliforme]
MDPYRRYSDQTRQPRTDVVYGDSQDILQARRPVPSSQGTFQLPPGHPRMQQTQANSQTYFTQDHQGTPSHQYAQGYSYAPSTQLAHQGSAGPQQYDDSFDAHHRVNLSGDEYSWDDPPRRTASYVRSGQQYNTGARYAQHVEDPERYGVKDAVGTITRFDSQFSGSTSTYARPQNPQRGVSPWPYPQRIDSGYRDYPQTSEYPSRDGKSSRRRQ